MSAEHMRKEILRLGSVATSMDTKEKAESVKVSEALARRLDDKVVNLISASGARPVLHQYTSDGTSYKTTHHEPMLDTTEPVKRSGKKLSTFLCERSYFVGADSSGEKQGLVVVKQPRYMVHGKTAMHEGTALRQAHHLPSIKSAGIKVTHYAFDRAVFSALERVAHNHHRLVHEVREKNAIVQGESLSPEIELQDWVVSSACALHDVHKSIQWSLMPYQEDRADILKDLHIVIESVRNSYNDIAGAVGGFVLSHLKHDDQPHSFSNARQWWIAMGASERWADRLATVNPVFKGGSCGSPCQKPQLASTAELSIVFCMSSNLSHTPNRAGQQ